MDLNDIFANIVLEREPLQEAVPKKAKDLGINPSNPPDLNKPGGSAPPQEEQKPPAETQQPSQEQPQQQGGQEEETPQQSPQPSQEEQPPSPQGQEGEALPEEGEEQQSPQEGEDDGEGQEEGQPSQEEEEEPEPPDTLDGDLEQGEKEIYSELKPEQFSIRKQELKDRFKDFNEMIVDSLDKLNKTTKTSFDIGMLEFITKKLLALKDLSRDYLIKTFDTKTYEENKAELETMFYSLQKLSNMIEEIRTSRYKRIKKSTEESKKKSMKDGSRFSLDDIIQDVIW